ncbi:hypothetical protein POM88_006966 [Heracleum sosnowskyi]|uniref:Uncharacterized protein n=1 Tax=Heracleum sosnowskyi TaxID=360622 RepID=A0AAD8J4J6_9APIA|nr:hypothetical protein POM88_006966 [Heracleum sosnowskyi]
MYKWLIPEVQVQGSLPVPPGCSLEKPNASKDFIVKGKTALASVGLFIDETYVDLKASTIGLEDCQRMSTSTNCLEHPQYYLHSHWIEELEEKYNKLSSFEKARTCWEYEYLVLSKQCMHGSKCKHGDHCTTGRRLQEVNILSGLILPVWGTIEKTLAEQVAIEVEQEEDSGDVVGETFTDYATDPEPESTESDNGFQVCDICKSEMGNIAPMFMLQAAHASCMFSSTSDRHSFCRLVLSFAKKKHKSISNKDVSIIYHKKLRGTTKQQSASHKFLM